MAQPPPPQEKPAPVFIRGVVKQILSGDNILIRGQPKGGPPPERQLALSNIIAPRIARRAVGDAPETFDEPCAWECREFLRKKLIGKDVQFSVEYKVPGTGKEYGSVFVKSPVTGELENITELLVAEGLVDVRQAGLKSEEQNKLNDLLDAAKSAGKGKWAADAKDRVRNITWTIENVRNFVDTKKGKPVDAIIEMVRDGSTVRAFLLPTFDYVTVMLTGIKCPMNRRENDGTETKEPFSAEAKYFTESRLLQRDIQIVLESVSNQNFLGSIIHPAGNIAELLLKEGFARCVDWSMAVLSSGHDVYRQAERSAKERQLRIWKDYVPSTVALDIKEKDFNAKVLEVVNSDAIVVKTPSGEHKKIFFSSLRPPRAQAPPAGGEDGPPAAREGKRGPPLYEVPYMFEAREFLRKKLIGKKVHVLIDYVKPANDGFPERTCATVKIADINIAEALISKGLATVLWHKQDDDQRSSCYDDLLAAETRANKNGKGLHSKKDVPTHRIADLSGDVNKSRQFLPFLQRAGKSNAVVEFVASGSRMRLFLPKETCLLTFLLAGISCPRVRAVNPAGTQISEEEPMGTEAFAYSKELVLQHEVQVQVDNIDKGGNFIGWMFVDGVNLSVALVENGFAKVHFTAERSNYYKELQTAEENAKNARKGLWKEFVEEVKETEVVEETERNVTYKKIIVTDVLGGNKFWAQHIDNSAAFEQMQAQLRADLTETPPLPGSLTPRRNDVVASKFVDDQWYRARIEQVKNDKIYVLYIDYGNREIVSSTKLAHLPPKYVSFPPQARQYSLGCIRVPEDDDIVHDLTNAFVKEALNNEFSLNVEYKFNGEDYVSLTNPETKADLARTLLAYGVCLVERRREKRLQNLVNDYCKAQETARKNRLNLWRYGDFTEDDAPEFGAV
jgi:staphylococcal nuclease domain-containing protein 1